VTPRAALPARASRALLAARAPAAVAALLAGLAPGAAACPYCSLSQGVDTLVYIAAFLVLPYLIVSGVWVWLKRLLASENEGSA
jgi:hypothetical protein